MAIFFPLLSFFITSNYFHANSLLPSYVPVLSVQQKTELFEYTTTHDNIEKTEKVSAINTSSGTVIHSVSIHAVEHSPVLEVCTGCEQKHPDPIVTVTPTPFPPTIIPIITIEPEPTEPMPIDPPPCDWRWKEPGIEHPMRSDMSISMPCPVLDNEAI